MQVTGVFSTSVEYESFGNTTNGNKQIYGIDINKEHCLSKKIVVKSFHVFRRNKSIFQIIHIYIAIKKNQFLKMNSSKRPVVFLQTMSCFLHFVNNAKAQFFNAKSSVRLKIKNSIKSANYCLSIYTFIKKYLVKKGIFYLHYF